MAHRKSKKSSLSKVGKFLLSSRETPSPRDLSSADLNKIRNIIGSGAMSDVEREAVRKRLKRKNLGR